MNKQILQVETITSNALLKEVERLLNEGFKAVAEKMTPPTNDTYLTRQQVAEMFNVTLPTVHSWMNAGILKPYKIGNKTRFLKSEVLKAAKTKEGEK
jgi:excisionase family DNA binding protein